MSTGSTGQTPSLEGFERLFAFLDADAERAAAKYEQVRQRLLKLFAWRGATPASEFVDRTVERVIRRISDGGERSVAEPYQYFYGVAMAVLRESGLGHADPEPRRGRGAAGRSERAGRGGTAPRRQPRAAGRRQAPRAGAARVDRRARAGVSLSVPGLSPQPIRDVA